MSLGLLPSLTLVPSESIAPEDEDPKLELPVRRNGCAARVHIASDVGQPREITGEVEQTSSPGTNIIMSDLAHDVITISLLRARLSGYMVRL